MDRRIILECGKVHRVCYTSFLFCKAMWLRLPSFQASYVLLDGTDALDVSFGGDEDLVLEFLEFFRTQGPDGAGVLRFREEEPPKEHPSDIGIQQHT